MSHLTISQLALIKISGVDAASFLQGQLTNDINQLDSKWQFSGYCNPKGRLLAMLRVWRFDQDYYALVSSDIVETIGQRLKMYVMRSKVDIEHCTKARVEYLASRHELEQLEQDFAALPEQISERNALQDSGSFLLSDPATQNYLYVDPAPTVEPGSQTEADQEWQRHNILAGVPQISADTSELFVPQMINLDLLDGINFRKGCYTGQEIVARMHYLGKLKQRMLVCDVDGQASTLANAGNKVFADDALTKSTGTILSVDSDANIALVVMRLSELESEHRLENGQRLLVREPQPYEVPR